MKTFYPTLLLLLGILFSPRPAGAQEELSARRIMEKAFARDDGADGYFRVEMVLVDKKGHERKRLLELYTKDYGDLTKSYLRFLSPPDIEKTSFLTWEEEGKDDTQYLYLPALGRSRRIVSSQKDLRFVNTDFTYEDMQRRRPEKDEHLLLGEEEYLGLPCYLVESLPREKTSQYSKRVSWVDKDDYVVLRTDFYGKKGGKIKELTVKRLERHQGIPTPMLTVMRDLKEEHRTVMTVTEVRYNQGIEDEIFTLRFLESD